MRGTGKKNNLLRCFYLTLHNGNPVQQLSDEHILLCNFCSQGFNLQNCLFVCLFYNNNLHNTQQFNGVWFWFILCTWNTLYEQQKVFVNPHLLYHGLDLPLLREHHVVEVLNSLSQFCRFPFQLLGPGREHVAYERYNICNKKLK